MHQTCWKLFVAFFACVCVTPLGQAQTNPPNISSLSPTSGPVGTLVTITGTNFAATQGASTLKFNGTAAAPTSWSDTQIVAPVPSGATQGKVQVTVNGLVSNGPIFTVGTPPSISSLSPTSGPVGTLVTITGTLFGATQGTSTVKFNGTAAAPTSWSDTRIVAPVPSGATQGKVQVTVNGLVSNGPIFTVGTPPSISSLSPSSGPLGTVVNITGTLFGATQGTSTVKFNGTVATPSSWSDTRIVAPVPSGAATGKVQVTVSGLVSNSPFFTLTTPPSISSLSPTSGAVGTSITITGTNFGSAQGSSTVSFNSSAAFPTSWSPTSIVVPVPSAATTGNVVVTVSGVPSNGAAFTVISNPIITSLSPGSGPAGTLITINGANFGPTQGTSTVTFNGVPATPATWTTTQIAASVPNSLNPGTTLVMVNTSAGSSSSTPFTVLVSSPTINLISTTIAIPGQQVTVFGTGFGTTQGSGTVQLGNTNAAPLIWADTYIVATVAPNAQSGVARVFQAGLASNQIGLTIVSPDTLTASASPAPNSNGWNNSNVTVTFACTTGGQPIPNCLSSQTVATEGAGQAVTGAVTGSGGSQLTASVTLNIDKTIPALAVTDPADGTSLSAAGVTVSGTLSDVLSGLSSITCNGAAATLSSGVFSCNISLNVGVNLVVVRATDVAGNVAASKLHLSLAGTLPSPQSLQITPATVNLLVGDTQTFTAVDELGRPRKDATWTISDTTLATISTDSSPLLTAVAVGQPTLTANVQGASAQIQVNILAATVLLPGTYRWAAPPVPGFALYQMLQAAPASANTPDLYSIETGTGNTVLIRAFTADGQQMWQQTLGNFSYSALPDAFGGLLVDTSTGRIDLDGVTGMPVWQSQATGSTIRQDGTIVAATPASLSMFDGNTGQQVLSVPLRQPTETTIFLYGLPTTIASLSPLSQSVGTPTVGPDGSVYLVCTTYDWTFVESRTTVNGEDHYSQTSASVDTVYLLTIPQNGIPQPKQISTAPNSLLYPGSAIPDGSGGVLASWTSSLSLPSHVTHLSTNGTNTFDLPLSGAASIALGTNGTAFATDGTNTAAFNISSSQVLWSHPGSIIEATYGSGVSIFDAQGNAVQIDSQGSAGTPVPCATCLAPFALNLWTPYTGTVGLLSGPVQALEASVFPMPTGNPQVQNAARPKIQVQVLSVTEAAVPQFYIQDKVNTAIGYWQLNGGILLDWDGRTIVPVPACAPTPPPNTPNWTCSPTGTDNNPNNIADPAAVTLPEIQRRFNPSPGKGIQILFLDTFLFGPPGFVHGYTPPFISNAAGVHNFVMYRNSSDQILGVAHEIGHVFLGPSHVLSINNLMCGHDSLAVDVLLIFYPCVSADANHLTIEQISGARKTASTLTE